MRLVVKSGPQRERALEVTPAGVTIGREPGCELLLDDPEVSRRHASLRALPGGSVELNDLGSRNGTWVGGERIAAPATLEGGERVKIGQTELAVETGDVTAPGAALGATGPPPPAAEASAEAAPEAPPPPAGPPAQPPPPPRRSDSAIRRSQSAVQRAMLQRSVRRNTVIGVSGLAIGVVAVILALTGVLGSDSDGGAAAAEATPAEIATAAKPSTVLVVAEIGGRPAFNGTGWVLDADEGLIVTNAHVVEPGETWEVGLTEDQLQDAEIVGIASCEDLAVLRIDDPETMTLEGGGGLETIPLGDQSELQQGDTVVALGFPGNFARDFTLQATTGTVSVVEEEADIGPRSGDLELQTYPNVIQTDAAINAGNSGGPLIDTEVELVGVNTLRGVGGSESQGYAIGVERVEEIVPILQEGTSIAWAGIDFFSTGTGLEINSVFPGSGAAGAGLDAGDVITHVDGRRVGTRQEYCNTVGEVRSGDQVEIEGRSFSRGRFVETIAYE